VSAAVAVFTMLVVASALRARARRRELREQREERT
jgi:hypothetical protein